MRLIDADKIIQKTYGVVIEDMFHMHETVEVVSTIDIEKAPTVPAIPIEWLHSIMKRQLIFAMESEMEGTTTVQDGVIHCVSGAVACQVLANVIELWEKENVE